MWSSTIIGRENLLSKFKTKTELHHNKSLKPENKIDM
jgi:hypothetical protein